MLLEQSNEFVFLIPLPLVLCLYAASEQSWLVDGSAASRTYCYIALSTITVSGYLGEILGVTIVTLGHTTPTVYSLFRMMCCRKVGVGCWFRPEIV